MMRWIIWLLTWLSSDPAEIDSAACRAAAAADCAYASMAKSVVPAGEGKTGGGKPGAECANGKCPPQRK